MMQTLASYTTLGRSGLRVSPLCLGAMTFGQDWDFGCSPEESAKIIDAYLEAGGNFIDTANIYTKGHSEKIIGDHLTGAPGKRDRIVLATKWLGNMHPGDPNAGGAHRKAMLSSLEQSLRRLQTDYIDLYWMHFWDRHTPIEETMRALDDMVAQGKLRYIGFSDTPAWKCAQAQMIAQFRGWAPLIALQIEYSLIERTPEADLIPMAMDMGMGVTPWSPLKGGLLTGKYTHDSHKEKGGREGWFDKHLDKPRVWKTIDEVLQVAKELDCPPAQIALAWCRRQAGVESIIIGASKLSQLQSNIGSLQVELNDEQLARLNQASSFERPFPHAFIEGTANTVQGGTTINGVASEPWRLSPATDDERW